MKKCSIYKFFPLIIVISAIFSISVSAQNKSIDSLKTRLPKVEGEEKIKTLLILSYNYLRISTEKSLEYSQMALSYSENTGNERGVARAFLMIGSGYNEKGEYTKAINYQQQALDIFEKIGDTAAIGKTYNNLGMNYHNLGQYKKAIEQYQNSYQIANTFNRKRDLYFSLNNIGIVYDEWGKYKPALEYFKNALIIAKDINNKSYTAISSQNIGVVYQELGKNDSAMLFINDALEISKQIGDKKGVFISLINLGDIYVKFNNNKKAINSYENAIETCKGSENKNNIALASLKLGEVFTHEKQYDKALHLLKEALKLAKEIEETKLIKDIYKALSDYYAKVNDYRKSLNYYVKYTNLKDTVYNRDSRREITEMQTLYELDKKEKEIEIQDLKIEQQQNRFYYIISAIGLLLILAILLFNRYKLKQKHFRIELEKKNIEIEQRLLRTQMNPHFIFNSLNSINSFITDNNSESAQSFLSKFARLMRYILENSRKTFVPVEDEVNTLNLNLELEQLRFDNKFDFEIKVNDDIDTEYTFVPPMLIQPFVENAIIHGVANKSEKGKIKVELIAEGELMLCIIEDNGIGRDKAMELKKKSGKAKHRSLGMQVTKERLEILNENTTEKAYFEFVDLKDENGNPKGTRVILKIPYEVE